MSITNDLPETIDRKLFTFMVGVAAGYLFKSILDDLELEREVDDLDEILRDEADDCPGSDRLP